jgi:aminopeptidase N
VSRRLVRLVLAQWTAPEALPAAERSVSAVAQEALEAGDAARGLAAMRRIAATTHDVELLRRWLASGEARPGLALDRDTRWMVVRRLVVLGEAGDDLVEREATDDRTASGHESALAARASRPTAEAKAGAWASLHDPKISNRDFGAVVFGLWTPGQEELTAPYLARYLEEAPAIAARGQAFSLDVGDATPRFPMALPRLESYRQALATAAEDLDNTVLRRQWDDTYDDLGVALRVRKAG